MGQVNRRAFMRIMVTASAAVSLGLRGTLAASGDFAEVEPEYVPTAELERYIDSYEWMELHSARSGVVTVVDILLTRVNFVGDPPARERVRLIRGLAQQLGARSVAT